MSNVWNMWEVWNPNTESWDKGPENNDGAAWEKVIKKYHTPYARMVNSKHVKVYVSGRWIDARSELPEGGLYYKQLLMFGGF